MGTTFVNHGSMTFKYEGEADGKLKQYRFEPKTLASDETDRGAAPNFILSCVGDGIGSMGGCGSMLSYNADAACKSFKTSKKGMTVVYLACGGKLQVTVKMDFIGGADAVRQTNSVKNISKEPVKINHFSSAFLPGIAAGGLDKWYENDGKIRVHHCLSHWQGEAQWVEDSLEHLGIFHKTAHSWDCTAYRIRSVGTWSTGRHYPCIMVEDTETGTVWYMEIEGGNSWTIELGNVNGAHGGSTYLEANAADEETGFVKELKPGETFTAASAIFGCTNGGFEEAAKNLLLAKRATTIMKWNDENVAPACFNDYMDCLWGCATREKLEPIIDRAAACGIELFCMDAGWYKEGLGSWIEDDSLYGEGGLRGMIDYIKSKGMTPGIWLEIESVIKDSALYKTGKLLERNGAYVNQGHFADFTQKEVREYLDGIIGKLYGMGIRFIKNDYNLSVMYGAEIDGSSVQEGLKINAEAFLSFIDEMQTKYEGLHIENCGSGAMRCDHGTLRHFALQSTSDQEFYYLNPAIISGMAACLAPEKAGIWSYPYPISFYENNGKKDIFSDKAYMDSMKDGEQTAFNMVNALCGTLYLSGRIDKADDFNLALIEEGVQVYKTYRTHINKAYPVWPCGKHVFGNKTHTALGFLSPDGKKLTLAVWKFKDTGDVIQIPLKKYTGSQNVDVKLAYPTAIDTEYRYFAGSGILSVKLPKNNSARFFEITIG